MYYSFEKGYNLLCFNGVAYISIVVICFILYGCAGTSRSVIATTGTTIGVELSQNQGSQTPIAVLGYKRAELAYVPTNWATITRTTTTTRTTTSENSNGKETIRIDEGTPETGNGASDSANVLMELRYRGIFAWGKDSGIYQRLAVGDIAVKQPGAAVMFGKDDKGDLNRNVAKYLKQAELEVELEQLEKIISYVTDEADQIDGNRIEGLVDEAKKAEDASDIMTSNKENYIKGARTGAELRKLLSDMMEEVIPLLYESLPIDKQ